MAHIFPALAANSVRRAAAAAAVTFAASGIGMVLQQFVADAVLADSKAAVGSVTGLFALLLALVLGLLVWTAFGVYSTQHSEVHALGPLIAKLDATMSEYGVEGARGRAGMIASLEQARIRFFGDRRNGPQGYTYEETRSKAFGMDAFFDSLEPATDRQRRTLQSGRDIAHQIAETQNLMTRQLHNPIPSFLLVVVVLWAAGLFFGNGLVAKANVVVAGAYVAGAAAVGSAIFLILELSSPYTGLFHLSSSELDGIIEVMKAEEEESSRDRHPRD